MPGKDEFLFLASFFIVDNSVSLYYILLSNTKYSVTQADVLVNRSVYRQPVSCPRDIQ